MERISQIQRVAFEKLIAKKRYEQITVQEIIDEANIGRSTFYAHFETKDSLLEAICEDLFHHIFIDHLTEEGDHDFSNSDDSLKAKLTHILYHLKTDQIRFRKMFSSESAELFWDYFKDCFQDKFKDEMRNLMQDKKSPVLEKFCRHFYITTFGRPQNGGLRAV